MGQTFRATGLAMVISIGDVGAIVGTQLYRIPLGGVANKNYHISYALTIVYLGLGAITAGSLWFGLDRANKKAAALPAKNESHEQLWKKSGFVYQV